MKKVYNPIKQHLTHPAEIRPGAGPHRAQLFCLKCKKHIKWLTEKEMKWQEN